MAEAGAEGNRKAPRSIDRWQAAEVEAVAG